MDYLWGDLKKHTSGRRFSKPMVDVDDDFELNFEGFKDDDESDIDEKDKVLSFDFLPTYKTMMYPFSIQRSCIFAASSFDHLAHLTGY